MIKLSGTASARSKTFNLLYKRSRADNPPPLKRNCAGANPRRTHEAYFAAARCSFILCRCFRPAHGPSHDAGESFCRNVETHYPQVKIYRRADAEKLDSGGWG